MNVDVKKKLSVNRYLMVVVFVLLIFASMQFIYLYLRSMSIAPNYTGTASDILIATTNIILATCAVLAFKNISSLFKDKISDKAINKIDTALMALDECIDKFSSLHLNIIIANMYKAANNPKDSQLVKQLDEASSNLKDAGALAYKAKFMFSSLTRWNISLDTEGGRRYNQLVDDAFELSTKATSMFITLINEITPNSRPISNNTFDELFIEFEEERIRIQKESDDLRRISIHEVFRIK
ncbi:MAG: hypothetical protein RSA84_13665 [Acinetobacter sp.]